MWLEEAEKEISQLALTDGNCLGDKSASTRLVVDLGANSHVQGMDWENALTVVNVSVKFVGVRFELT